jgi:pyruvate dehydrogenase E2 component (dihydrolipoamide acetyltransferase)
MKIFRLPDLGEGLAEAEVREWYVKVGDEVKVDQPLVSMETAKSIVDVPSPYAGKIVELHGAANAVIKTGSPFITFDTGEGVAAPAPVADKGSVVGKLETSESKWDDGQVTIGAAKAKSTTIKAMPAARVLASQLGIDLSQVTPTGPQGLITADDVKKCINHQSQSSVAMTDGEALHGVRRVMAQAMSQSHREIVPVTIIEDADITDVPKTDMTVRLLKAIAAAAKEEPALNAWFDGKTLSRKLFSDVNIGMATDTEEGLFVPVLKQVQDKSPEELRQIIDGYKVAVRERSIPAADMQGATITLSNFGTISGQYATPIIVPPAVAILGAGRGREVPLVRNGQVVVGKVLPLSLTFDHRAVTGGEATRFLGAVIKHLQG